MFGIMLGVWTIKYAGVSRINWMYKKKPKEHHKSSFMKALSKMKPEVLQQHDWAMFNSLTRYCQVIFYIFFVLSVDAMNFFLKFVLWISAESDLCKARLAIWAFAAIAASKEYYIFIDDPNCKRVGPTLWLCCYTLFIEYSICFKFYRGMFDTGFPDYVKLIHFVYFGTIFLGGVYAYFNSRNLKQKKKAYNTVDPEITVEDTQAVLKKDK